MLWKRFVIKNFKGIKEVGIDLDAGSNIYTIVGLNESGKTTLLEAINFFGQEVKSHEKANDIVPINQDLLIKYSEDLYELIPLPKRMSFDDTIEITGYFTMTDEDIQDICNQCGVNSIEKHKLYSVTRKYTFAASKLNRSENASLWENIIAYKYITQDNGKKKKTKLEYSSQEWINIANHIKDKLPSILYFPTFAFEIPEQIFLQPEINNLDNKALLKNKYYLAVLQDILDSIDDNLTIKLHLLNRMVSNNSHELESMRQTLLRISHQINSIRLIPSSCTNGKEFLVGN